ncbi:MAG: hypothetical protein JRG73_19220 [Deltaproteobacteria bacterium]|nr:hypothetical protein [Deltaproteobacteria bacterium]MBW2309060.1 hypothetical protein [Deltaproteobacteria bacterium]
MNKSEAQRRPGARRGVLMALCCLVPLAALGVLLWLDIIGSWGLYLFFILCPLSHFLLMRKMKNGHHHGSR